MLYFLKDFKKLHKLDNLRINFKIYGKNLKTQIVSHKFSSFDFLQKCDEFRLHGFSIWKLRIVLIW